MKTQAFISVFKVRIDKLKDSIKEELNKTKSERRRDALKSWISDIKRLQKVIDEAKRENTCPHCGGELSIIKGRRGPMPSLMSNDKL